ncbi:hypothetical protein N7492_005980 [Penicillium capsulatum]|uniref:Uncharacterized protein n=1 Tax=Penicillium capsulatum TaxID=69766 RepID=A0A9W9IGW8_9EURO|nr:hypothetical protein N7492_005980 [Penicillium capsulatum]KAJ6134916.1 hypothetical protein N7512_000076 [Penicillium capsulatum]
MEFPVGLPDPSLSSDYYPRDSTDATEVFDTLRQWLPSELALAILDQAEYWLLSQTRGNNRMSYDEDDCRDRTPYLTSEAISGERCPVRKIRITVESHDQGWSDHHEDHGTFRNSWTWFELDSHRLDGEDVSEAIVRLATNVHARSDSMLHERIYRSDGDEWVQRLQPGDQLAIVPRARFPGWTNYVEEASIEIYTVPVL